MEVDLKKEALDLGSCFDCFPSQRAGLRSFHQTVCRSSHHMESMINPVLLSPTPHSKTEDMNHVNEWRSIQKWLFNLFYSSPSSLIYGQRVSLPWPALHDLILNTGSRVTAVNGFSPGYVRSPRQPCSQCEQCKKLSPCVVRNQVVTGHDLLRKTWRQARLGNLMTDVAVTLSSYEWAVSS